MTIRLATKADIPRLLEMVEQYAFENPSKILSNSNNHDSVYVSQFLFEIINGKGFILIDNYMRGFIVGLISKNIWCPKIRELHELVWWVEKEHRDGFLGGKLWKKFNDISSQMLEDKRVNLVFTSVTANGPMIDYTKRGYAVFEAKFFKETT
jgi:hypothetical protein